LQLFFSEFLFGGTGLDLTARLCLAIIDVYPAAVAKAGTGKEKRPWANKQWRTRLQCQIDAAKNYRLTMETTKGTIVLELYPSMPKTVNNFVFLSKEGFYDGVVFHRVIDDFVIQGGDPTGTGRGGPVTSSRMNARAIP